MSERKIFTLMDAIQNAGAAALDSRRLAPLAEVATLLPKAGHYVARRSAIAHALQRMVHPGLWLNNPPEGLPPCAVGDNCWIEWEPTPEYLALIAPDSANTILGAFVGRRANKSTSDDNNLFHITFIIGHRDHEMVEYAAREWRIRQPVIPSVLPIVVMVDCAAGRREPRDDFDALQKAMAIGLAKVYAPETESERALCTHLARRLIPLIPGNWHAARETVEAWPRGKEFQLIGELGVNALFLVTLFRLMRHPEIVYFDPLDREPARQSAKARGRLRPLDDVRLISVNLIDARPHLAREISDSPAHNSAGFKMRRHVVKGHWAHSKYGNPFWRREHERGIDDPITRPTGTRVVSRMPAGTKKRKAPSS